MFTTSVAAVALPAVHNQNGAGDANSVSSFINNLFANGGGQVRNAAVMQPGIITASTAGAVAGVGAPPASAEGYWLIDAPTQAIILDLWAEIWEANATVAGPFVNPRAGTPAGALVIQSDIDLIAQMARYVQANNLSLFTPDIVSAGTTAAGVPINTITGYSSRALSLLPVAAPPPNRPRIRHFLSLFATGAHIVVATDPDDVGANMIQPFWQLFQKALTNWALTVTQPAGPLNALSGTAYMHSHYSGIGGGSNVGAAYAYPNTVTSTGTPTLCPFVCSFLAGCTSHNNQNTFLQLEGWPGTLVAGFGALGAHSQDFAAHNATKWNISTYGASPYSEKRGTTVFLAPAGWAPSCETVIWPRFTGSTTTQGWYAKDLLRPNAPPLALNVV